MPQHAYWKGHVRLSLVTFPVRLYPAVTESEKIRLHKYDKDTGQRIHYQNVNEDGDIVETDDIVKGYEYEKGAFIPIEDISIKIPCSFLTLLKDGRGLLRLSRLFSPFPQQVTKNIPC